MHTEHTANQALATLTEAQAAERARWARVLAAPSKARQHYKPAPAPSRVVAWARVGASVAGWAFVGVLLALAV